jgi:hypothetical protein
MGVTLKRRKGSMDIIEKEREDYKKVFGERAAQRILGLYDVFSVLCTMCNQSKGTTGEEGSSGRYP